MKVVSCFREFNWFCISKNYNLCGKTCLFNTFIKSFTFWRNSLLTRKIDKKSWLNLIELLTQTQERWHKGIITIFFSTKLRVFFNIILPYTLPKFHLTRFLKTIFVRSILFSFMCLLAIERIKQYVDYIPGRFGKTNNISIIWKYKIKDKIKLWTYFYLLHGA